MTVRALICLFSVITFIFPACAEQPCKKEDCLMAESMPVKDAMDFPVLWGAYYTYKEEGKYVVFRLLDFNADAIHYAIFKEEFEMRPKAKEIRGLSPYIGHVPFEVGTLLHKSELELTASAPLTLTDLEGYGYYLGEFGMKANELSEFKTKLIEFSHKEPLLTHLKMHGDRVEVSVLD